MIWFAQGPDDGSTSVGISEIKLLADAHGRPRRAAYGMNSGPLSV